MMDELTSKFDEFNKELDSLNEEATGLLQKMGAPFSNTNEWEAQLSEELSL